MGARLAPPEPGKEVVRIADPETQRHESQGITAASPEMFKAFWPDVGGSYFFRNRRLFLDFMHSNGGRIYYLTSASHPRPPFILVGNWRSRADITALWHVKGEENLRRSLVSVAASASFQAGSERFVTKPLGAFEGEEFERWGFKPAYRIVLLERILRPEPGHPGGEDGMEIIRFRKRYLDEVLSLDATAFDDFWRLDIRTVEAVAASCYRNTFLLARRGGETLGYAVGGANGRFGYLQRLGVHAGHQGEGVGGALARRIMSDLRGMGATSVMVNTQEDNEAALNLYHKLGFETMPDPRFIMQCTPRSLERDS